MKDKEKQLTNLKIGEWTHTEDKSAPWTIRLSKDSWYSSKNQDTIMIMHLIMKIK